MDVCEPCLEGNAAGHFQTLEAMVMAASLEEQRRIYAQLANAFAI
ncbi:MAG TPA: hypothetical protein V6D00_07030 [Pantanalinema sp.]